MSFRRLLTSLLLAVITLSGFVVHAHAEIIRSFDVDIRITTDGSLNISENISYDFENDERHGIFRYIPLSTKLQDNLYRDIKVHPTNIYRDQQIEKYTQSYDSGNINIKIGDPDKTISGLHTYQINYLVENALGNFEDHDELYWNITGNKWPVPILAASSTVHPPQGITIQKDICFTGVYGSRKANCTYSSALRKTQTTKTLSQGEGLTIALAFPADSFPKSTLTTSSSTETNLSDQSIEQIVIIILGALLFMNIGLPLALTVWYQTSKRKSVKYGPPAVNFDLPQNSDGSRLSPAEAGTIDTAKLEQNDITATIFDLAIRKYLKIEQKTVERNFLLFKNQDKEYYLHKLEPQPSEPLLPHERILTEKLFNAGNDIAISELSEDFYKTFQEMEKSVFQQLIEDKYYTKNPSMQRNLLRFLAILSFCFGGIISAAAFLILSKILNGRTTVGDQTDWKIDGLKLFLSKMQRNYTWQADQLAVVEQMIPYAMALGYIDKFMEQLKIIMPDYQPDWYVGSTPFYDATPNFLSATQSNFTQYAPSSSSGFSSGGGFSGGGGGGGGGGSW